MLDRFQDVRHALRMFRRQPGFAAAVLSTLALGIGASTAMFSVLNAVLLKPLPQQNAERIVRIYQPNDDSQTTGLSPLEIADMRRQAGTVVEEIVEYHSMPFTFIGEREAQRLQTGVVSASYFEALGIRPLVGRTFVPGEDQPGSEPVLVLAHGYWQREFGSDPAVVGRTLRMNDRVHTVVGVLPPFPQYPDENDVYMPVSSCPFRSAAHWAEDRSARGLAVFALLRPGIDRVAALPELRALAARLRSAHPEAYRPDVRYDIAAVPLGELLARPARATLVILLSATVMLLAIVCSNVGNLMIVRVLRRDAEMAVRLAFGATRWRLLRQLMTESAVIAVAGGVLGLLVALASTGALASFIARFTPRAAEVTIDRPVLLFAVAACALTALVAGLLPVVALRRAAAATLRQGAGRTSASRVHARVRNALIVMQVAVSLVLVVGAGVLVRTLIQLQRADPGFDAAGVMTARLDLNWTRYDSADRRYGFYRELEQAITQLPGVAAAGIGSSFPLNGDPLNAVSFAVQDRNSSADAPAVAALTASAGYFQALGVPLLRGRTFAAADENRAAEAVAVITRSLARRYWPDGDAIGRRISLDGGQSWGSVVGVVGDIRHGLEGEFDHLVFVPHNRFAGIESRLLVRSAMPAATVERMIRATVAAIDAEQPVTEILSLDAHRGARLATYRITALLMSIFAGSALGITAVGLGGAIAFSIAQRTREIGIRIAVGAQPLTILRMVLGQMAALVLTGTIVGVAAALFGLRYLRTLAFGVPGSNLLTTAVVVALILAVATAAGLIPARRAVAIDPASALQDG